MYTTVTPGDVYQRRWILREVFSDALASTDPLFHLISQYVTNDMLAAIAREYDRGRLLLIGTTDLDVQWPLIWNVGGNREEGGPDALDLIRKILLASASVPGLFRQ